MVVPMRWLAIALALFVFAIVGVGCGGGDDEASDDSGITITTDTTETDDTSTDETTDDTETTDTDVAGDFASEECQDLADATEALSGAFGGGGSGDLSEQSEAFDKLVDAAPDEIKSDVEVLAKAYAEYADVLADIDLAPGETPSAAQAIQLSQALASVDQQGVAEASQRVGVWAQENCTSAG